MSDELKSFIALTMAATSCILSEKAVLKCIRDAMSRLTCTEVLAGRFESATKYARLAEEAGSYIEKEGC